VKSEQLLDSLSQLLVCAARLVKESGSFRRIAFWGGSENGLFVHNESLAYLERPAAGAGPTDPAPLVDENGEGPDIDSKVYAGAKGDPDIDPDTFIDNVKTHIKLGAMFKNRTTRQPLDLSIRMRGQFGGWAPSAWSLHSVDDLYLLQDPNDKDIRTLTTFDPSGQTNADFFELRHQGVTVGIYRIQLEWIMRIVSWP
jgi:hypothetical protein